MKRKVHATTQSQTKRSRTQGSFTPSSELILQSKIRNEIRKREMRTVEMKAYDVANFTEVVTYNGHVEPISPPIARGTGPADRIGSEIHIKGVLARLHYLSDFTYNGIRTIIIRWNASGTPTCANILQTTGTAFAPYSPLIRDASHKFQVLYDNLQVLGTENNLQHSVDKIYLKNIGNAVWDDNNTPQKGQIFACFISDAAIEGFEVEASFRVRYTDS